MSVAVEHSPHCASYIGLYCSRQCYEAAQAQTADDGAASDEPNSTVLPDRDTL